MAVIKSGSSTDQANVDANKNLLTIEGLRHWGTVGGPWIVSGSQSAIVAAALGANVNLMSFRVSAAATKAIYITRLHLELVPVTPGAAGGVPGTIAWQRFTAQTPTGGGARTPARKDLGSGGAGTDVTDVRDSNAALTGVAPTWGDIIAYHLLPLAGANTVSAVYDDLFSASQNPAVRLAAGDGIGLRTAVASPATATWVYSYIVEWFEQ